MRMSIVNLPAPQPFDTNPELGCISTHWKKRTQSFEYFIDATAVHNDQRKKAILLHSAGPQVQETFTTLTVASELFMDTLNSLNLYFNPKKNVHYERYKFLQLKQEDGETIDNFVTRLKIHVKSCDYNNYNEDEVVIDKLILSCTHPNIQNILLKEAAPKKFTIENALFIGRTIQITTKNAQEIENKDRHNLEEDINKIKITNTSSSKFYQGPLRNSY